MQKNTHDVIYGAKLELFQTEWLKLGSEQDSMVVCIIFLACSVVWYLSVARCLGKLVPSNSLLISGVPCLCIVTFSNLFPGLH